MARNIGSSSRVDTHLLGNNVSSPDMNVDGVQRGWQEQVLALTVKRLTLESITQMIRGTLQSCLTTESLKYSGKQTKSD